MTPCGGEGPANLGLVLLPASGSRGPWCCRHSLSSVAVACHDAALLPLCESPSVEIAQRRDRSNAAAYTAGVDSRIDTDTLAEQPDAGYLVMSVPAGVAARSRREFPDRRPLLHYCIAAGRQHRY